MNDPLYADILETAESCKLAVEKILYRSGSSIQVRIYLLKYYYITYLQQHQPINNYKLENSFMCCKSYYREKNV